MAMYIFIFINILGHFIEVEHGSVTARLSSFRVYPPAAIPVQIQAPGKLRKQLPWQENPEEPVAREMHPEEADSDLVVVSEGIMPNRKLPMHVNLVTRKPGDDTGASRRDPRQDMRLLILADRVDAQSATDALHKAGVDFISRRVDGEHAFIRDLDDFAPSLVLADTALAAYGGRLALAHTRRTHPEIPVIIMSDRPGEEETVELLKVGARDYVAKDRLARLGPAVLAALQWEDGRRRRGMSEQAMRVSEIRYRRLFESAQDGILILDAETGRISDANPFMATLLGYTREEFLGRSLWEIGAFKDEAANRAAFTELQKYRYIRYEDLPLQTKDGRDVAVEFVSNVYREQDQNVIQCNIRDITARKATEKKLFEAQKMEALGILSGGMAHDINNMLGVIIGNLDMVRPMLGVQGGAEELVGEALAASVSGAELMRRVLAFARHQPLQPERVEVNAVVSGMAKLLRRTLGEDIKISLHLESDVWPVTTDSAQLEASLANLATNARDAMPGGGRLTITTRNCHLDADYAARHPDVVAGDYAMIEVSDNGNGVPADMLGRIFEPFFTTKDRGNGTGLGLSMVFGFMKQSGGHVTVDSKEGAGATFSLYLPRSVGNENAQAQPAPPSPPAPLGGGETILVVEDNFAMRNLVLRQLESLGYGVLAAESAAAALAVLSIEKPDLLFTDVVMPGGMDGVELARAAMARAPSLKVLVTSGYPEMNLDSHGHAVNGLRLLSKPYRKDDLARALRQAFDT
jgi:PAS domain S-box-containing protein